MRAINTRCTHLFVPAHVRHVRRVISHMPVGILAEVATTGAGRHWLANLLDRYMITLCQYNCECRQCRVEMQSVSCPVVPAGGLKSGEQSRSIVVGPYSWFSVTRCIKVCGCGRLASGARRQFRKGKPHKVPRWTAYLLIFLHPQSQCSP